MKLLTPTDSNLVRLRRQAHDAAVIGRRTGARGNLVVDWDLEKWSLVYERLPSQILRLDPKRYGKPVYVDDPTLLDRLTPDRVMARILPDESFDAPHDMSYFHREMAKLLGIDLKDVPVACAYYAGRNLITDAGENIAAKLLTGNTETALDNSNAYIGVSSNTTASAETDTSIPSATWKGQNATYPADPSGSSFQLQSDFLTGEANHAWNRWGLANGNNPPTTGRLFSTKTESLGTKASGTWTLTATVSID